MGHRAPKREDTQKERAPQQPRQAAHEDAEFQRQAARSPEQRSDASEPSEDEPGVAPRTPVAGP